MSAEQQSEVKPEQQEEQEQEELKEFPEVGESALAGGCTEIESLCMNCGENGVTRLMLTSIPHFRDLIISSFSCDGCGEKNTETKFGGQLQPHGVRLRLDVKSRQDLDRQMVKSDSCEIRIPELDFEVPQGKGLLSTVEGIVNQAIQGLEQDQPVRRIMHPEDAAKIDEFVPKLQSCLTLETPFTLELSDSSGNSFIQSPNPAKDPELKIYHFDRTVEDNYKLGLATEDDYAAYQEAMHKEGQEGVEIGPGYNTKRTETEESAIDEGAEMGYALPETCHACGKIGHLRMAKIDIPHFKETVIMSFKCEICGYKSNEVKTGGAIPEHGQRLFLKVETETDLNRDVLKSNTSNVSIPEAEFELQGGSLQSRFTTVQGLVTAMMDQLKSINSAGFSLGDAATEGEKGAFTKMLERLQDFSDGKEKFTLVLDDPIGHSYIQSTADKLEDDPNLDQELYERTQEQEDELGITDLKQLDMEEHQKQ